MLRRGRDRAEGLVQYDTDRLAVEAARRDPRRFDPLYRKYVAQVYSFALYELRDQHAAEDLTAQVFLHALAGLPGFREQADGPHSSFRVWLFQIARHSLSNERRRVRRHPQEPLELAAVVPSRHDVAREVASRDEMSRALRTIDSLSEDRRRALLLRFVNELSTREIGEVLGKSEGAVRVTIHRALRAVAAQLSREQNRPPD